MDYLSLFTGGMGGDLAMQHLLGFKCKGYVEIDEYCQKLIRQRQEDGLIDKAPIFTDIRTFISDGYAASYTGMVDLITGGFPCQDISIANKQPLGLCGERSGLWREMAECIRIIRPEYIYLENSPMLTIRGLGDIMRDLALLGYDAEWDCISACDLGGHHQRSRLWILAYTDGLRLSWGEIRGRSPKGRKIIEQQLQRLREAIIWTDVSNPRAYGSPDALAYRVERSHTIGNGQVPIVAATAFRILSGGLE